MSGVAVPGSPAWRVLAGSLALHGAAFAVVLCSTTRAAVLAHVVAPPSAPFAIDETPIDETKEDEKPPSPSPDKAATPRPNASPPPHRASSVPPSALPSAAPDEQASPGWSFHPTTESAPRRLDLRYAAPAASATARETSAELSPPDAPAPASPAGIAEALATNDAALGLGRAAPVVSALRRAALDHGEATGNAVVRLEIDGAGRARSARVLHASSGARAWQAIADAAASAVLAAGVAGATVDVRLEVIEKAPARGQVHPIDTCTGALEQDCRGSLWATVSSDTHVDRSIVAAILRIARR
jgi:hypothetical protein